MKNKHSTSDLNTSFLPVAFLRDTSGVKFIVKTTKKPFLFAFLLPPEYELEEYVDLLEFHRSVFEHNYQEFREDLSSFKYKDRKEYFDKICRDKNLYEK